MLTLFDDLEEADEATAAKAAKATPEEADRGDAEERAVAVPDQWRAPGAVLCLAGRGAFDALLATMLGQALARRGFGVQVGGQGSETGTTPPRLVCLCFIEGGASAATARYTLRRVRRRLPDVPALALAWSAEPDGAVAAALETEGHPTPVVLTRGVAETVDLAVDTACGDAEPAVREADVAPAGARRVAVEAAATVQSALPGAAAAPA